MQNWGALDIDGLYVWGELQNLGDRSDLGETLMSGGYGSIKSSSGTPILFQR